jgi:hypothetical protein
MHLLLSFIIIKELQFLYLTCHKLNAKPYVFIIKFKKILILLLCSCKKSSIFRNYILGKLFYHAYTQHPMYFSKIVFVNRLLFLEISLDKCRKTDPKTFEFTSLTSNILQKETHTHTQQNV